MSAYRRMDGSDAAARGLREAIRLAKEEGAQLFIIHVVNEYYAFANLDGAAPVDNRAHARRRTAAARLCGAGSS